MFTGLIQQVGEMRGIETSDGGSRLFVGEAEWNPALKLGESVAVNGVCLTVSSFRGNTFACDVLQETLDRTSLGDKKRGDPVNLERALAAGGLLGGHIVTGHVDGIGSVVFSKAMGRDLTLRILCEDHLLAGMVMKGSVALDGVSLTITRLSEASSGARSGFFETYLVPHTRACTALDSLSEGVRVNIETDMIGKYVYRHMTLAGSSPSVSMDRLRSAGFDS